MRRSFRTRLFAIVGVAGLGLVVILISSALVERRVTAQIDQIREEYIPKIGLQEKLETAFERVSHALRDAAEASDLEGIDVAVRHQNALLGLIDGSRHALTASESVSLRSAVEAYFAAAKPVTQRMIRGEAGDDLAHAQLAMQDKQSHVHEVIKTAGQFDEEGLATAFASVVEAQQTGERIRLGISLASVGLVLLLSLWITRGMYRSLGELTAGFRRFGEGTLDAPIPTSDDELGEVAKDANQMAERLRRLAEERDANVWLKAGQVGLANELRGELAPAEVADRAIAYLARYLGAPAGLVHYDDGEQFRTFGRYAAPEGGAFALGEGLVGEAAKRADITIIAAPAGHLPIRSGLAGGDPRTLVFVPLIHNETVRGVIELALLAEWQPAHAELVLAVRGAIAVAIEVARTRAATHALLDETQRQATELLAARRGLEQKAEELARASTYKSQFLASMSHELRTPLNAIIGFSELMRDDAIPAGSDEARECLDDILTSGRHLLQLINDILDLSKVEAGKLEFMPERTRLSTIVTEVLAILKAAAAKARVQITTTIAPEIDEVTLDPARLKQVLYNYLSNALKFTPEGGRVMVRAFAESDRSIHPAIRIEIEDTGIGIAPEELEKLFSDFHQTRDGQQQGTGTGLGLALTRRLVEAQGGSVGVRSVVGSGTVFHAVLPRNMAASQTLAPILVERAGAPRVLVVEDDPADRDRLVEILARSGYAIDAVATGKQAVERLATRSYDAITLDLLLPDMTGAEVLQQASANGKVPVVIVVTVVAEPGAVAGFAVHDVLAKPVDGRTLIASLARAGVTSGKVLVVDDDPASLRLMSTTLSQLGYSSVCELDASTGLQAALAGNPSAIVLDLIMPGMTGFQFLDHLHADPAGRTIPVIVWTSKDLSASERAELARSAHGIVTKGSDNSARVVAELAAVLPVRKGA